MLQINQNQKPVLPLQEIIDLSPVTIIGFCGALGSSTGELLTFGFDNVKTRMQMNGKQGLPSYNGFFDCIKQTFQNSGVSGFYRGFSASVLRQMTYSTVRISVYEHTKRNYMSQDQQTQFLYKFLAGGIGGAIGCVVGTPADILKIRLINDFQKTRYRGIVDCYHKVMATEGMGGFMRGLNVNIVRAILVNAAELSAYDQAKTILQKKFDVSADCLYLHFMSSTVAGFFGAVCSSPADVVKTRYMNQDRNAKNGYKSALDCSVKIFKNEGFGAFYKGFLSYFLRIAPWNICMFMSYEQYKKMILPVYLGVDAQN